ncbi:MAG: helix-hairpin-helix domain-containing protein [Thioalkalispiraceae bacterium]
MTGRRHDPCVIDVFISAVKYMEGGPPRKWWEFTKERKKKLAQHTHKQR